MLIKTLSHIWGKLNLPILLFRVGLLTLINMGFLDIPRQIVVNGVVSLIIVMMNG